MDRRRFLQGSSALMGHAAFAQVLAAFAGGAGALAADGAGRYFSAAQMRTLAALVDTILPQTDSPAASAANTHGFVDLAVPACATPVQQRTLQQGLAQAMADGFVTRNSAEQIAWLATRAKADMALPYDESFFRILKDYTLTGYFHSEIGATQALAYERVPGGYWGDVPLMPGQKAWAI